jgi:flagellar basal body-associated protein FliL
MDVQRTDNICLMAFVKSSFYALNVLLLIITIIIVILSVVAVVAVVVVVIAVSSSSHHFYVTVPTASVRKAFLMAPNCQIFCIFSAGLWVV